MINKRTVTLEAIIKLQEALIELYEVEKEGTEKFNLFRDSYKSQIESLKNEIYL